MSLTETERIYQRDYKRKLRNSQTAEEAEAARQRYSDWRRRNDPRLNAARRGQRGAYTKARYAALHRKTDMQLAAERDGRRARWREKARKRKRTVEQLEAARVWRQSQKQRLAAKKRDLRKIDPAFLMCGRLRNSLRDALRKAGTKKTTSVMNLVGISIQALVGHLQDNFLPGMSWDRFREIHIDHIRPCCSFDLTDPEQQKQCFHYTNLRPLWAVDNLRKSGTWKPEGIDV